MMTCGASLGHNDAVDKISFPCYNENTVFGYEFFSAFTTKPSFENAAGKKEQFFQ